MTGLEGMTDSEIIGALQTQCANYEAQIATLEETGNEAVSIIMQLVAANRALQRQLLDKRGFWSALVDGRVIVMGRN